MASDEDSMINVMLHAIFVFAGIVAVAPTLQRIISAMPSARMLQAQAYTGQTDARVLTATSTLQWLNLISGPPYTGWISASFHNDGWTEGAVHHDWSVFIGINNPDELHELASDEDYDVNMSGGERRIEYVFFKTNPGQKASVRAIGKY